MIFVNRVSVETASNLIDFSVKGLKYQSPIAHMSGARRPRLLSSSAARTSLVMSDVMSTGRGGMCLAGTGLDTV